jgi:hypothetical protein
VDFPAYYVATGDSVFAPTEATTSPWDESAQHGGPPTALLATAMERAIGDPEMRMARITAEFLGVIPRREAVVVTRVLRPGRRIALTEADLVVDDRTVVTARAWHLRVGPPPPEGTNRPEAPTWPHPEPPDALLYHLAVPKLFFKHHGFYFVPGNAFRFEEVRTCIWRMAI